MQAVVGQEIVPEKLDQMAEKADSEKTMNITEKMSD